MLRRGIRQGATVWKKFGLVYLQLAALMWIHVKFTESTYLADELEYNLDDGVPSMFTKIPFRWKGEEHHLNRVRDASKLLIKYIFAEHWPTHRVFRCGTAYRCLNSFALINQFKRMSFTQEFIQAKPINHQSFCLITLGMCRPQEWLSSLRFRSVNDHLNHNRYWQCTKNCLLLCPLQHRPQKQCKSLRFRVFRESRDDGSREIQIDRASEIGWGKGW